MGIKEYQSKRALIKIELKETDNHLKVVLNDRQLKNSTDVVELQIKRLAYLDQLRFLRPVNKSDVAYRNHIFDTFPEWAENNIPDEMRLVFHGTTLANTERILNSGRIISGKDRWSIHTSGDDSGEISVSTKDFLRISMKYHMDLIETFREYEWFIPSGTLFVLKLNEQEYQSAKSQQRTHNIYLRKNPEQLHAIITTPENKDRVKWWMQKNNFSPEKVYDFDSFKDKIDEDRIFLSLIKSQHKNHLR